MHTRRPLVSPQREARARVLAGPARHTTRAYVHVCTCRCVRARVHVQACTCRCARARVYVHVCTCTCVRARAYGYMCMCTARGTGLRIQGDTSPRVTKACAVRPELGCAQAAGTTRARACPSYAWQLCEGACTRLVHGQWWATCGVGCAAVARASPRDTISETSESGARPMTLDR